MNDGATLLERMNTTDANTWWLLAAAEKLKIVLSSLSQMHVIVEMALAIEISMSVNQSESENMSYDFVATVVPVTKKRIRNFGFVDAELMGGHSQTPFVQHVFTKSLNTETIEQSLDRDYAVALGGRELLQIALPKMANRLNQMFRSYTAGQYHCRVHSSHRPGLHQTCVYGGLQIKGRIAWNCLRFCHAFLIRIGPSQSVHQYVETFHNVTDLISHRCSLVISGCG
jgi:hypothetical protein